MLQRLRDFLGSRKPVAAVRISGSTWADLGVEIQADSETEKVRRLRVFVEDLLRSRQSQLGAEEWTRLLSSSEPSPDDRWVLLLRLAATPDKNLRDQFVALPDGTVFSMRLLTLESRGGGPDQIDGVGPLDFARIADAARVRVLRLAVQKQAAQPCEITDEDIARLLEEAAEELGIPVGSLTAKHASRLREKLKKNDAEWPFHMSRNRKSKRVRPLQDRRGLHG